MPSYTLFTELAKHSYKNTLFYKILQSVILTLHNCIKLTLKDPAVTEKTIKTPNNKTEKDKNRKVTVNKYILNNDKDVNPVLRVCPYAV